ncbi:hypothetical protein PC128_g18130 [Phytophthora cactorum]|nr:hypothetical protein PC128_g18130 [Phytophthora cactorum]
MLQCPGWWVFPTLARISEEQPFTGSRFCGGAATKLPTAILRRASNPPHHSQGWPLRPKSRAGAVTHHPRVDAPQFDSTSPRLNITGDRAGDPCKARINRCYPR